MNRSLVALLLLCCALFAITASALLLVQGRRRDLARARLRAVARSQAEASASGPRRSTVTAALAVLGAVVLSTSLLSSRTVASMERLLAGANIRGETALARFVGLKIVLLMAMPALAVAALSVLHPTRQTLIFGAGATATIGLLAPEAWVRRRRARRIAALERGLPDALDMLVICAEAGLALEGAMERVTRDIATAWPEVAEEFAVTGSELRITNDRRTALVRLGSRLDIDCFRRLSMTLVQSMQIGTPLSRAMRMLAAEMRQDQMARYEAKAAKLPVLLTIPMIVFILPTVFLVVAGPAAIQVIRTMR